MDGDDTPATVPPSPPSWTSLTLDDLVAMSKGDPTNKAESNSGGTDSGGPAMSEEERKRRRPQRQRGAPAPSPFALCHAGPPAAASKSGSGVNGDEVVISSVIGYALVRLEAHKDKITAATLEKPLSASDLLELTELQEILSAELKTSGRVPSITMRKDARATMSFGASNSLGSSSSSTRQSVRSAPQSTNAFALDPAKLTACEPQVLLSLIREYCRVHIRLFPTSTQRALAACLDIKCTSFRLNAMHSLVYFLPSGNRTMLQYLLSFLGNLLKNGDKNGIVIDSLAIIFGPCLLRSRPEDPDREVALGVSILREMIEHYERLFVEFKDMTWRVSTDGISQLAVARVEQIVETAVDPNYLEEPFVDILFLTHDYYITSTQLLNHFIELYERNKGKEEHTVDIRLRTLETVDYWVHCFRSCFDSAHTFLQRLEEFVAQLSKEIKQSTHSEEWAILVSLTECAEEKRRQANLSDEEKEKEEEEEKKGGINWLRKRRGSQLGNHRLSLNPQGKLSSALRAIRKSGSESKKGKKEREKGSGGESSSDMEAVPENGEPAKERRRSKGKDNKAKDTVGDAGSEGDSPKKTKTKTKTTKKKKGSFVMFRGLESGYKKMSADEPPMKENEKEGEKDEEAKAERGKNEAKNENESTSLAEQERTTDTSTAVAEVAESKEPEQERATEEKEMETPPALAKEKEEGAKKVTMDATAETAQSGDGRASRGVTEEAFARKAQLERSVTISSRTLYAMMGKGFQQMKASDAPSADQSADRTSESSPAAKRRSGEELASSPAGSPAKPRREASPLARRKNEEDQNSSPSVRRNHSTEDSAVPAGGGGKRDSGEEAERRKKKAQSADKASPRSERRLSRRATRADLNSASLSSSMSTTHIRERDPKREVVKERRGSFMIRTLSLSGSFAVPQKSLKDEHQREEHRATRDERKGSVSLASGQSWAGIVPVHSAKEDIEFLSADPGHIARQLTLMDWELFESINCGELLKGRFMQPDESPSFAAMVKRFNMTGQWVCCTLLQYETAVERAKAIEQCIKICAECQKLHNFNSFFAIVGGLNTTAISRLKGSWEKVPKRATRLYKDIMELAATDGNFWNYRSVLKKTPLPLIPYLAICTQDLFKVEEKQTFVSGGMVYFEKMRLLWQFYSSFRKWQSAPYNFVVDRGMRAFLNDFAPLSEKEMYNRSYKVEPRTGGSVVV